MSDNITAAEVTADSTASQPGPAGADAGAGAGAGAGQHLDIEVTTQDLLVEEVSIDGMCGVY
jgi:mycofactocin precursor